MISESFDRVDAPVETGGGYTEISEISPGLFRARRAGKFFILKTAKDNSARAANLLKREYSLCCGLTHPHIVSIFTFEESTPAGPAIIMEYVEGRTLDSYLQEKPKLQDRKRIFLQLLDAVGYIHRSGLIHNDLKPQNIVVTSKDNDLKIIDFGLSDDDSNYLEKTLGATPQYASPELLAYRERLDSTLDARSDIYSIGKLMQDIFPGRYRSISSRCTRQDHNSRYSSIDDLKRAWKRRNRPYQIASAVLLLAMLILPTILLLKERQRLADANTSIQAIQGTADSLRLQSESLRKEKEKEEAFNRYRDSLMKVLEYQIDAEAKLCLKACDDYYSSKAYLDAFSKQPLWGDQYQRSLEKLKKQIDIMAESYTGSPEEKILLKNALRSHLNTLSDDKMYTPAFNREKWWWSQIQK